MIYRLTAKSGRRNHIDHFLRRLDEGSYTELATEDEGVVLVEITGQLPGYPPVLVEALPE